MGNLDRLLASGVERLKASPRILALIEAGDLGEDLDFTETYPESVPWIFQGTDEDFVKPFRDPVGTGKGTLTVCYTRDWAANMHNTADFPVLTIAVHADSTRNDDGTVAARDGLLRAVRIAEAADEVFHDPANLHHLWPMGVEVHSCVRTSREMTSIPRTDAAAFRALSTYNVIM